MKKKVVIAFIILIIVGYGIYKNLPANNNAQLQPNEPQIQTTEQIVIEIKGEIARPGIYIVTSEERIYSVISLAGGFTENAEKNSLNLAQKVYDGMVITVPSKVNETEDETKISINNASVEELMKLAGIGQVRALAIIDYRNSKGPFTTLEGLMEVSGISQNIFNQIKDDICL